MAADLSRVKPSNKDAIVDEIRLLLAEQRIFVLVILILWAVRRMSLQLVLKLLIIQEEKFLLGTTQDLAVANSRLNFLYTVLAGDMSFFWARTRKKALAIAAFSKHC